MCLHSFRHVIYLLACRYHGEPHTPLPAAAQRSGSQPSPARRTARAARGKLASPETPPLKRLRRRPPARRALPPHSRRRRRHRAAKAPAVRLWTRRASMMTWKARCLQSCGQRLLQRTKRCAGTFKDSMSSVSTRPGKKQYQLHCLHCSAVNKCYLQVASSVSTSPRGCRASAHNCVAELAEAICLLSTRTEAGEL